ncbi:MAG: GNAT family N-acetyltransferase [Chloroflexia bacterium]
MLEIRRARPEDREVVLSFCAHTWEDGDYIPHVWEAWLADEQGPLLVGVWEGRVAAIEKITRASADEVWLEGLRVDPQHRRKGLARALFHDALEWAGANGIRFVRLATSSSNATVQRMVEAAGLRHVLSCPYYQGEALAEGEEPECLPPEVAGEIWERLHRWGGLERAHHLYAYEWAWRPLDAPRLQEHLAAGQVWGVRRARRLVALAIVEKRGEEPVIGFLDGENEGLVRLARSLRFWARRHPSGEIAALPREEPALLSALEEAGYRRVWDFSFWVYEGVLR